jgi:hypothetical protein
VEADKEAAEAKMQSEREATAKSEGKEESEEEKQLNARALESFRTYAINRGFPEHFANALRL